MIDMIFPAKCHCGSTSSEHHYGEQRWICAHCKRPLWMPIETAPKDGRVILVHGCWYPGDLGRAIAFTYWHDEDRAWVFDGEEMMVMLYWMPLPEAPRE